MSLRTLKNRLREFGLRRKDYQETDENQVRQYIEEETSGPGSSRGYRNMWHHLRIKHNIQAKEGDGGTVTSRG